MVYSSGSSDMKVFSWDLYMGFYCFFLLLYDVSVKYHHMLSGCLLLSYWTIDCPLTATCCVKTAET